MDTMREVLRAVVVAGLLVAAVGITVRPAHAQAFESGAATAVDKAQELKRVGNEAMERGRPADALAMYRAAYETDPNAALLYNIGRAYLALGNYPQSLSYLERFENEADPELKRRVPHLASLIADVRGRVTTVTIVCNVNGATVRLGDRRLGKSPLDGPIQVNSGRFTLEVTSDQHLPYGQAVVLEGGGRVTLNVKLDSKETHGVLKVRSPEPGVRALVDGKLRGMLPVELRLPAGPHRIELRKEGFETVTTSAVVEAGKEKVVTAQIDEEPEFYERWWFWTGVGVVVAGTVTATIARSMEKGPDTGTIPPGTISSALRF